jgi:hypothetical protein
MANYTHRKKADGTWDSICMTCYHTAARSLTEPQLRETEAMHLCEGSPRKRTVADVFDSPRKRVDLVNL